LSSAFSAQAPSLGSVQDDYKKNVFAVSAYVNGVLQSNLPVMPNYPPDWNDFETARTNAAGAAATWVDQVLYRLTTVPASVEGYDGVIAGLLTDANTQAQQLVRNPNDAEAKAQLAEGLTNLASQFTLVKNFIASTVQAAQTYSMQLPGIAQNLTFISDKAADDAKADQDALNKLQAKLTDLQDDISSLTNAIIALAIVDGIALTVGTVITIAAWPFGALAWFMMGPVVLAASLVIELDAEKLKQDKAELQGIQQDMSNETASVAVLTTLASSYNTLAGKTGDVEQSLQSILDEWDALESSVIAAIGDITEAVNNEQTSDYSGIVTDLADAATAWAASYSGAKSLEITINVNDAEVQTALANGTTSALVPTLVAASA
jgi:flagellar hook-associated protein FlgK